MDDIKRIVEELDGRVPREGAKVNLQKYDCGEEDSVLAFVTANERGYLRLGIEFLKAAVAPHAPAERSNGERPHMVEVDLDYLITEDSDVNFDYFERREDVTVRGAGPESLADKLIPLAILGVIVLILVLALVGLVAVVRAVV